jgi:hypothetical protein
VDGLHEIRRGLRLHDIADRPGLQSREDVGLVRVHRQQDRLGLGHSLPQPAGRLEAIQVRHGDIQEGHRRRVRVGQLQGLQAIGGLAYDDHARLLQQDPNALADEDMIVSQEDANRHEDTPSEVKPSRASAPSAPGSDQRAQMNGYVLQRI